MQKSIPNRSVICLITCFIVTASSIGQSKKSGSLLLNEQFRFNIISLNANILDSNIIDPSTTLIKSKISRHDSTVLSKLGYSKWMDLLSNNSTDWATNLFLYDVYKRDATAFKIIKNRKQWLKCCKEKDIEIWKIELSKHLTN